MAETTLNGTSRRVETPALLRELGSTGLKHTGGYTQEEFLRELSGPRGMRVYREMASNDATIGAILFAIEMLVRQVPWRVEPADASPQALEWAERIHSALFDDMSQSWPMLLSEILTFLPYGWAYHEIIWKRCLGDQPPRGYVPGDPAWAWWAPSRFTDGLLTFRKLPIRAQETLLRWEFDASGGVQGMTQQADAQQVTIPIDKALLFRAFSWKGNPEGKSILRNAYESWYYAKHIRRLEGIGVERDLAGMFHARIPIQYFDQEAPPAEQAVFEYVKKMATRVHRDEQEGLVTPLVYDEHGNELFKFELLTTGGQRQLDTDKIVQRYDLRIMQSVLANVLMVGVQGVGSYALSLSLSDLFTVAITTFLDAPAEVFNRHALPRLWKLNALPPELMPTLVHGDVKHVDFEKFTAGVLRLAQAGFQFTPQDEAHIRMQVGFPEVEAEALEEDEATMQAPPSREPDTEEMPS